MNLTCKKLILGKLIILQKYIKYFPALTYFPQNISCDSLLCKYMDPVREGTSHRFGKYSLSYIL